ncbi:MAG: right-handed parallel beta-helix repeat-containing protein [bacterium]
MFIATILWANSNLLAANYTVKPGESIYAKLAVLQPGDTLFVRAGTYGESLSLPRSGVDGQPIVLMAFPGEKPLIESSETIFTLNKSYWIIDGFIFDHKNADSDAILISSRASHNIIRNCEIRNGRRDGFDIKSGASDNVLENNIIHDFFKSGTDAHGIVTNPGVLRLKILNNTIYDCSGDCIQLYANNSDPVSSYSRNITISGNILYTTLGSDSENALDFKGVDTCIVANNEMYGFQDKAMVVQKGCRNITVESNIIRDSQRGMEFRGEGGKSQKNIFVRKNLIYNIDKFYAVKFDWVDSVQFVNNTLALVTPTAIRIEEEGVTNGIFKNNLFYKCGKPSIKGTFQADFSHNGWFSTPAGDLSGPNDQTGSNPNLLDEDKYVFKLASGSPAIDRGTDVGLSYQGKAPDLGAFEFDGNTTSVKIPTGVPTGFLLEQNWPNPFSLSEHSNTRFIFSSSVIYDVELRVYNLLGQKIKTLRKGSVRVGKNIASWDGRAASGRKVSPGIYFVELKVGEAKLVRSFVAIR